MSDDNVENSKMLNNAEDGALVSTLNKKNCLIKDFSEKKINDFNSVSSPTSPKSKLQEIKYELVPPDGGWGWLVLFGSMLINILVPGTIKSSGVLLIEFKEAFNAEEMAINMIPATCYFLYSSLGPLSSILSVKYSYRTVAFIGGTFAALGMMLSFWASSVTFLALSYGVLVGSGAGLSFPPTVYIVTSYFVRFRGLANGLCISGSALGSIILPAILPWLIETYGYRGTMLIMGAVILNVWIAAIFYEPVEKHMKRVPIEQKTLENIEEEDIGIILKFETDYDTTYEPKFITSDEKLHINSPEIVKIPHDLDNNFVRSASAVVVQNCARNDDIGNQRTRKISTPLKIPPRNQTFTTGQLSSTPSLYAVPEAGRSNNKLSRTSILRHSKNRLQKRSPSTSSFQYISTPYHGSTLSFQPKEFSSHLSLKSITSSSKITDKDQKGNSASEKVERQKFFDFSLLCDPVYLIILISNSTNAIGYTNFIVLLPSYALTLGFDKDLASYLLAIVSTTDLIGRIGGSALSDTGFIPKTWYFVGGLAFSGISLAILPAAKTYGWLSFFCASFGLASGVYVGVTAVIMADMLGTQRLTSSYGISLFVNGILQLIGPPICGAWSAYSGSYVPLFTTLGFVLLAGASLWGFIPIIYRRRKLNQQI